MVAVGSAHLQPGSKGLPQVLQRGPVQRGLDCLQPLAVGLQLLQLTALLLSSERLPVPQHLLCRSCLAGTGCCQISQLLASVLLSEAYGVLETRLKGHVVRARRDQGGGVESRWMAHRLS